MDNLITKLRVLNSLLAGWNILLFVGFIILIGITEVIVNLTENFPALVNEFWISVTVTILISLILAVYGGKRLYRYFCTLERNGNLVWLGIMVFITVTSFPAQLVYTSPG